MGGFVITSTGVIARMQIVWTGREWTSLMEDGHVYASIKAANNAITRMEKTYPYSVEWSRACVKEEREVAS